MFVLPGDVPEGCDLNSKPILQILHV